MKEAFDEALNGSKKTKKGLKEVETRADKLRIAFEKFGEKTHNSFVKVGSGIGKTFKTLTSFKTLLGGALAVSAAKDVLNTFTSFDDAARGAAAVMGATEEVFKKVSAAARQAGKETRFTAVEAAQGVEQLGRALGDSEKAVKSLNKTLQLASAGNIDVAEGVRIATGAMAAYGLEVENLAQVVDVLAVTDSTTKATIQGLGESMQYVGGTARAMGVDFEELISMLGLMANSNLDASSAGTSLNRAFTSMLKPTGAAIKMLEELKDRLGGVELQVKDTDGSFIGMIPILKQLKAAGIDAGEALELFDIRGGRAMQALMIQGFEKLEEQTKKARDGIGTVKRISDFKEGGLGGIIRKLISAFTELKISFVAAFDRDIIGVIDDLRGYILDLITRVQELRDDGSLKEWADETLESLETVKEAATLIGKAIIGVSKAVKFLYEGHSEKLLEDLDERQRQEEGEKTGVYSFKIKRAAVIRAIREHKEWEAKKIAEEEEKALRKTQKPIGKAGFVAPVKPVSTKKTEKEIRQELENRIASDIASVMRSLADLSVGDVQRELMYEAGKISVEDYFKGRKDSLTDQFNAEKEMLESALKLAETDSERISIKTEIYELEKQQIIDLMKLEEERSKAKTDADQKALSLTKQNLADTAEMFKQAYEVGGEKIKAFFYLSKAASLAQATMNIAEGITGAFKSGTPVMSQIQAGIVAAMGAVQVSKILSTNLADGGIVPGISPHDKADDKRVNLTSGEFVHSVDSVKYYGADVMSALNKKMIPRELFGNLPRTISPSKSFSLAGGGIVPNNSQATSQDSSENDRPNIVNIVDPRMVEQYLSSADGQNAIINVISSRAQTIKKALR